ncbi:MAG: GGDEF domain-containing protein, partial [Burkholderiales bacterium]
VRALDPALNGRVCRASDQEPPNFKGELRHRRKDGSFVWTDVLAYPITDMQGKLVEILGVSRDIEQRKHHELELQQARDDAETAKVALERANAALERANAELKHLASTDELTGAENRRQFETTISNHMALAKRHGDPLSLVMFDIDYFKNVNDAYGHTAGDQVLAELSDVVRSSLWAGDVFARWGGRGVFDHAAALRFGQRGHDCRRPSSALCTTRIFPRWPCHCQFWGDSVAAR